MTNTATLLKTAHAAEIERVATNLDYIKASDRAGRLGTPASFRKEDKAHAAAVAARDAAKTAVAAALAAMKAEGITEARFTDDEVTLIGYTNEDYAGLSFTRAQD